MISAIISTRVSSLARELEWDYIKTCTFNGFFENVALSEGGSFITLMGGIFSLVSVPIPARGAGY